MDWAWLIAIGGYTLERLIERVDELPDVCNRGQTTFIFIY